MDYPVLESGQQLFVVQMEGGAEHRFDSMADLTEWTYSPEASALAELTYYCQDNSDAVGHEHYSDGTVIDDDGTRVRIVTKGAQAVERLEREITRRDERMRPSLGPDANKCPWC